MKLQQPLQLQEGATSNKMFILRDKNDETRANPRSYLLERGF